MGSQWPSLSTASKLLVAAAICAASPEVAIAQPAAPEPATTSQAIESDAPAVLKKRAVAIYPPDALRDGIEGVVPLELTVSEDGHVIDAHVIAPQGHGFDEAALAAVKEFLFEPARSRGVAVRSTVPYNVGFHRPGSEGTPGPIGAVAAIDVEVRGEQQGPPPPKAASESTTTQTELSLRPRRRTEGVLEAVPGLFAVQHAGGGKAEQYFLRGFDLDHGTDLAFMIDGAPINAVSHGHGQGYSDLNFIIPETIDSLSSTKGPYSARIGDFNVAGSTTFHMADHVKESFVKAEIGQNGHERGVVVWSPDLGDKWRFVMAAEAFNENGPFVHPEKFARFNGYMKATRVIDDKSEVSLMLMGYGGSWNASGVLPARAVCGESDGTPRPAAYSGSNCISRWDSIDPSQGGESQRFMALSTYKRKVEDGDFEATLYGLYSNLQLIPNDGIAASFQPAGLQYGSEVEQDDTRGEIGSNVRVTKKVSVAGMDLISTAGLQLRFDAIHSALHRDEDRIKLDGSPGIPGPITMSGINEAEIGAYIEEEWRPAKWVRFVLGGRADRVDVNVENESPTAVDKVAGNKGATQFSPKAAAIISPFKQWDLFANYGRGFHTNDARTIVEGTATTLIVRATGYEVGTSIRPIKGLSFSAVAFLLNLDSELTIDGDTASTEPAGPTRRYGGELSGRFEFRHGLYADAALTVTHARFTDETDIKSGNAFVELAPVRTFSASVGAREPVGPVTLVGSVSVRSMSDRPATTDNTLTATGFTIINAEAGIRYKHIEVAADLLNIANTEWREGQFAVASRLPKEGPNPAEGISFTPGIPRTFQAHATAYW